MAPPAYDRSGVLQNEIREALPDGDYGQCIADRLGRRLGLITSVDDLVDLVDHMNLLLKPPEEDSSSAHGRERRASSVARSHPTRAFYHSKPLQRPYLSIFHHM